MLDYDVDVMDNEYDEDEEKVLSHREVREYLDEVEGIDYSFDDNDNLIVHTTIVESEIDEIPSFGLIVDEYTTSELVAAIKNVQAQKEQFDLFLREHARKLGHWLWLVVPHGQYYNYRGPGEFEVYKESQVNEGQVLELVTNTQKNVALLCGAVELVKNKYYTIVSIDDVDMYATAMAKLCEAVRENFNDFCQENIAKVEQGIADYDNDTITIDDLRDMGLHDYWRDEELDYIIGENSIKVIYYSWQPFELEREHVFSVPSHINLVDD